MSMTMRPCASCSSCISPAGYSVEVAADGIEAGYSVLRSPPDLLLVDVNMPYLSGIDLMASVIADRTVPAIPFIFLSSDETRMDHGYRLGAAAYVLKPVVKGRLIDAVDRALKRSRQHDGHIRVAA